MKITLELPDELMRQVKLRAIDRHQNLKDTIAQLLELGMAAAPQAQAPSRAPRPVRLLKRGRITIEDIQSAIAAGRE